MDSPSPIWTLLPGLHGSGELFGPLKRHIPAGVAVETVDLPSHGKQDYDTLLEHLIDSLDLSQTTPRILIAESFSGPLALRLTEYLASQHCIAGLVIAASYAEPPVNPALTLFPLRPLFLVKPPRKALQHFLIGDDSTEVDISALRNAIQSAPAKTLSRRIHAVLEMDQDSIPDLPKIPMLLLQAMSDNIVPWSVQQKLELRYPHADVHWIESPHLILQQRAEEACESIQQWLDR
ncbi:MAG: alpha/beta fold hydrolase [Akkermansiaceae bacterium]